EPTCGRRLYASLGKQPEQKKQSRSEQRQQRASAAKRSRDGRPGEPERQQEKYRRQHFGAAYDAGHRLGVDRVHGEDRRRGEGGERRKQVESDEEEKNAGERVQREVDGVVAGRVEASQAIIERVAPDRQRPVKPRIDRARVFL